MSFLSELMKEILNESVTLINQINKGLCTEKFYFLYFIGEKTKVGVGKKKKTFLTEVIYAHQGCIYLFKNNVKKSSIIKYYNLFL